MRSFPRHIATALLVAAWGVLLLGGVLHDFADHHDEIAASCEFCFASAHAVAVDSAGPAAPVLPGIDFVPETDGTRADSPLDRDHPVRAPPVLS